MRLISASLSGVVLATSCATPGVPPIPESPAPGRTPPPDVTETARESPPLEAPLASCRAVGPLRCALPRSAPAELCTAASTCTPAPAEVNFDDLSVECERQYGGKPLEDAFKQEHPAPRASGVQATAALEMRAYHDESASFGASYLVARFADGYCIVDQVFDWNHHRSYFETDVVTRWESTPGGFRLHLQAHRVCHESLDQEELASGVSDVTCEECARLVYAVQDGRFARIERTSQEGACRDGEAP
ncbi:MAG TPA: hypothetical protein VGK73_33815 [Polyangiaceae bacterium]